MAKKRSRELKDDMVRRNKGDGSIIRKTDGTYIVRMHRGKKADGKANIKSRRAKTQKEAEKKLNDIRREFEREEKQKTVGFEKYTTEEYFNLFLQYKKRGLSELSFIRLESTIRNHVIANLGMTMFINVKSDDIQEVLDGMYERNMSFSSIKKVYDAFNACFKWAVEKRKDLLHDENPMIEVEMISSKKFKQHKIRSFTEKEAKAFQKEALRKFKNGQYAHKIGPAFVLMLNTGIREGELSAINRDRDIDLVNGILDIHDNAITIKDFTSKSSRRKKWVTNIKENSTKTTSGYRTIPLNKQAENMIRLLLEEYPEGGKQNLLIYTSGGAPIPPASLVKPFKHICKLAGIASMEGHGPHVLRHTFATRLFENGFEVKVISELLGHKDVGVTQNTYIDVIRYVKIKAVNMVDDI